MSNATIDSIHEKTFSGSSENKRRKKPHKYRELLTHLQCCTTAPLSFKEQAEICGCSVILAKQVTRDNVDAKIITKTTTVYKGDARGLTGKNIYGRGEAFDPRAHLISGLDLEISKQEIVTRYGIQRTVLVRKFVPGKSQQNSKNKCESSGKTQNHTPKKNLKKNSSKEEFAKRKHQEFSSSFEKRNYKKDFFQHKFDTLKSFSFEDLAKKAPSWWFKDLEKIKKALQLLRHKIRKGYSCRNPFKFLCFLMKRGTFGYRRHVARNLSLAVAKPTMDRVLPFLEGSEPLRQTYDGLVKLRKSYGLKMDFTNVQKLLRKKFPHLIAAVSVCLKRLSLEGGDKIRNFNGFLNFLVGMTNPYDYLKRKEA